MCALNAYVRNKQQVKKSNLFLALIHLGIVGNFLCSDLALLSQSCSTTSGLAVQDLLAALV